jgi:quercetin dioxygenase-like cupin family protein
MPQRCRLARELVLVVGLLLAVSAITAVVGQIHLSAAGRGERRVVAESKFSVTDPALQAELVLLVVDFAPGAWTSLHTHGGQAINLVLEGEITLRHAGMERPHRAGQAWTDSTGQPHAAGNTGRGKARLLTNFLLPKGAPQTTALQDSPLEPTIVSEARFALPTLAADTEIMQQVADLPSGWRAERTAMGFTANILLDGEVTYQLGGQRVQYKAGESWSGGASTVVMEQNRSARVARVFTTYLLPKGAGR